MQKFNPDYILSGWERLHDNLNQLTEDELQKLLAAEREGLNRRNYLNRIHARYSKLRNLRERKEIIGKGVINNGKT